PCHRARGSTRSNTKIAKGLVRPDGRLLAGLLGSSLLSGRFLGRRRLLGSGLHSLAHSLDSFFHNGFGGLYGFLHHGLRSLHSLIGGRLHGFGHSLDGIVHSFDSLLGGGLGAGLLDGFHHLFGSIGSSIHHILGSGGQFRLRLGGAGLGAGLRLAGHFTDGPVLGGTVLVTPDLQGCTVVGVH